jgi:hypothetical protein
MIYFGVQLFRRSFHIVCLSSGFIPIATKHLYFDSWHKLDPWLKSLLHDPSEDTSWFFDEIEFNKTGSLAHLFESCEHCDYIYTINHRKLIEMARFLYDWKSFCLNHQYLKGRQNSDVPLLLASAFKIFDKNDIKLLNTEDDLPF